MQHRFRFLATHMASSSLWRIEGDEFFHLRKVLRLKVGAELEVFSLDGVWGEGLLVELDRDFALVEVGNPQSTPIPTPKLALAIGALQQQTMAELIPCLVELGLDEIHIFLQDGSAKTRLNEKSLGRWNKIALSAMKQCKRVHAPIIKAWDSLEECLEMASKEFELRSFLDPEGERALSGLNLQKEKPLCLFLGSEKGFSSSELEQFKNAGVEPMRLGQSILRSYTAGIAATSLLIAKRDAL